MCNLLLRSLHGDDVARGSRARLRRKLHADALKQLGDDIGEGIELPEATDPKKVDYHCWHIGSLAAYQVGGKQWKRWEPAMVKALTSLQRMGGDVHDRTHGSWDSNSAWGSAGGRVYATAINCLTLQTSRRFRPASDQR
ncbi:MAG: hypothetical protein AB7S36_01415 [Planctomycetota bacterium]